MRYVLLLLLIFVLAASVSAQTPTPGADASIYATLTGGQMSRFTYSVTASDMQIATLLTLIFFSGWAMFFFGLFVLARSKR